jgi:hypothetical protein
MKRCKQLFVLRSEQSAYKDAPVSPSASSSSSSTPAIVPVVPAAKLNHVKIFDLFCSDSIAPP